MSKSRIIITDPHGCYNTLMALIAQLPKDIPITFAGDLIDRGPDSRKIIEFVKNNGYDCVRGNHEQMMIEELRFRPKPNGQPGEEQIYTDDYHGIWRMNGGDRCLQSYLIDAEEVMDTGEIHQFKTHDIAALKDHIAWLKTLPYHIEYRDSWNAAGSYLLVTHSTAAHVWDDYSPQHPQFQMKVIWDRDNFPPKIDGIYNVFGHTPRQYKPQIEDNFANIDTGAYFKKGPYGRMTALQFPEMIVYSQDNVESEPI